MEAVRCPVDDYVAALKTAIDEINIAIRAARRMSEDE